jgi:hypothetical protein
MIVTREIDKSQDTATENQPIINAAPRHRNSRTARKPEYITEKDM